MRSLRRHRGITTWLAIVGYVIVASGVPLPLGVSPPATPGAAAASGMAKRLAGKDRSRPFPCMDKPCGCATAEQCFTRCCCNTPAETLAWARAHGVEPGVIAALERRVGPAPPVAIATALPVIDTVSAIDIVAARDTVPASDTVPVSDTVPASATGCCATTKVRPTCCATRDDEAAGRATRAPSGCSMPESNEPPRPRSLSLRAMLACGGIVAEWFAAGASLPPPAPEMSEILVVVERREGGDHAAAGVRAAPDAPPPRAA